MRKSMKYHSLSYYRRQEKRKAARVQSDAEASDTIADVNFRPSPSNMRVASVNAGVIASNFSNVSLGVLYQYHF